MLNLEKEKRKAKNWEGDGMRLSRLKKGLRKKERLGPEHLGVG